MYINNAYMSKCRYAYWLQPHVQTNAGIGEAQENVAKIETKYRL